MTRLCESLIVAACLAEPNFGSGPRWFPGWLFMLLATGWIGVAVPNLGGREAFVLSVCFIGVRSAIFVRWRARVRAVRQPGEVVVALPFDGVWWCAHGGPAIETNYHVVSTAQRGAYDFCGAPLLVRALLLLTRSNRAFAAYGREIRSPVDGTVVGARDGVPDNRPPLFGSNGDIAGNHIVIETGAGYLWLAHLQPGSVRHRRGDRITTGEVIGRCGNTGRSTEPHLHIHMQSSGRLNDGEAVPLAFRRSDGTICRPLRGDRVRQARVRA